MASANMDMLSTLTVERFNCADEDEFSDDEEDQPINANKEAEITQIEAWRLELVP